MKIAVRNKLNVFILLLIVGLLSAITMQATVKGNDNSVILTCTNQEVHVDPSIPKASAHFVLVFQTTTIMRHPGEIWIQFPEAYWMEGLSETDQIDELGIASLDVANVAWSIVHVGGYSKVITDDLSVDPLTLGADVSIPPDRINTQLTQPWIPDGQIRLTINDTHGTTAFPPGTWVRVDFWGPASENPGRPNAGIVNPEVEGQYELCMATDEEQDLSCAELEINVPPGEHILVVNDLGRGSVAKYPDQASYAAGTVVTMTANAAQGWTFDRWSGDLSDTSNTITTTMDSDRVVTAIFVAQNGHNLTIDTIGNGIVVKEPDQVTYTQGAVISLTALPSTGWTFGRWSGDLSGISNSAAITMDDSKVVTATFNTAPTIYVEPKVIDAESHYTFLFQNTTPLPDFGEIWVQFPEAYWAEGLTETDQIDALGTAIPEVANVAWSSDQVNGYSKVISDNLSIDPLTLGADMSIPPDRIDTQLTQPWIPDGQVRLTIGDAQRLAGLPAGAWIRVDFWGSTSENPGRPSGLSHKLLG